MGLNKLLHADVDWYTFPKKFLMEMAQDIFYIGDCTNGRYLCGSAEESRKRDFIFDFSI